jgi:hypothetical protein
MERIKTWFKTFGAFTLGTVACLAMTIAVIFAWGEKEHVSNKAAAYSALGLPKISVEPSSWNKMRNMDRYSEARWHVTMLGDYSAYASRYTKGWTDKSKAFIHRPVGSERWVFAGYDIEPASLSTSSMGFLLTTFWKQWTSGFIVVCLAGYALTQRHKSVVTDKRTELAGDMLDVLDTEDISHKLSDVKESLDSAVPDKPKDTEDVAHSDIVAQLLQDGVITEDAATSIRNRIESDKQELKTATNT